ncbi:MAG: error-prone DNA polymerase, partial [Rhodobacteraceae bacterium]|nr:error-prone DNA polymerase [Paracoccaceae bacterium]
RLSLRAHPMELLRPRLPASLPHERLTHARGRVTVSGIVITRQRPGTASGVIFLTLEDETGVSNVVVWRRVYEMFRPAVIAGRLLCVTGRIEREGDVVHLIAEHIRDLSSHLSLLGQGRADLPEPPGTAPAYPAPARHPRDQARKVFPSRDFH